MSIFDSYDEEFRGLCRDAASKLSHASSYEDSPEKKLELLRHCEAIIGQAADLVKQMDVEVR